MKSTKGKIRAVAVLAAVAGLTLANTAPAEAATVTRYCSSTARMCLHYNTTGNGLNAEFGSDTSIWTLNYAVNGGVYYKFIAGAQGSAGAGTNVWNNAGAGRNYSSSANFKVWENSNYTGNFTTVPYSDTVNLGVVQNDNTSMGWV